MLFGNRISIPNPVTSLVNSGSQTAYPKTGAFRKQDFGPTPSEFTLKIRYLESESLSPKTGAFRELDFCPKASEFTLETVNPEPKTSYPETGAFREPDIGAPARHGEAGHTRGPHHPGVELRANR